MEVHHSNVYSSHSKVCLLHHEKNILYDTTILISIKMHHGDDIYGIIKRCVFCGIGTDIYIQTIIFVASKPINTVMLSFRYLWKFIIVMSTVIIPRHASCVIKICILYIFQQWYLLRCIFVVHHIEVWVSSIRCSIYGL